MCEFLSEPNKRGLPPSCRPLVAAFSPCPGKLGGLMLRLPLEMPFWADSEDSREEISEKLPSTSEMLLCHCKCPVQVSNVWSCSVVSLLWHSLIIWIFPQVSENTRVGGVYCKTFFYSLSSQPELCHSLCGQENLTFNKPHTSFLGYLRQGSWKFQEARGAETMHKFETGSMPPCTFSNMKRGLLC